MSAGVEQLVIHGFAAIPAADRAVVSTVNDHAFDGATSVMLVLTRLGGTEAVLAICALLGALLALLGRRRELVALALAVGATQAVVAAVKLLVARPRPPRTDALVEAAGYAFPSGHAATAATLYGVLALAAATGLRGRLRAAVLALLGALVVAIGLTRIYLGAHYPSDVLAGWLVGAAIAAAAWRLARVAGPGRAPPAAA